MRAVRGRPRTFDRDQALEAALELFWRQGYTVTAIGDLTEQMGIGRQSLYDTFGDKHSLYLEALQRYCDRRLQMAREVLQADGSPLANLLKYTAKWRQEVLEGNHGCMLVNSSTELGNDDAAARIMERVMRRLEDLMAATLERASEAGELATSAHPKQVARLMLAAANGLAAKSHLGVDPEEVDDVSSAIGYLLARR